MAREGAPDGKEAAMVVGSFMPAHSVWDAALETLERDFPSHQFLKALAPDSPEVPSVEAALVGQLPRETFEAATSLKAVFLPITGVNHIPVELLAKRGVRVFNVHSNAFDVAERALALTLAYYGRVIEYHNDLRQSVWHGMWARGGAEDNWDSIHGKTCTILGAGAIGGDLAKLLKAFSCTVYGWRRHAGQPVPEGFDAIVPDIAEAVAKAEIVFAILPATPLTTGIVSKELLASMKGKFFVNVGRGSTVDEEGLYLALRDGILKGAAIDTWYTYPATGKIGAPSRFPIHELPNVILSPHVGGSTNQARDKSVDSTLRNIRDYLNTGTCAREADLAAMY
jgi:phosphoglycerate dehydrogenase-like enzyme